MRDICPFCDLLKNPCDNSTFIAEFEYTIAFLNFNQSHYLGQSILILKEHHDHLHLVPTILQQKTVPELMKLTEALLKAFGGFRANHQSLGNSVSHIHWHITPRYPGDKNEGGPPHHDPSSMVTRLTDDEYRQHAIKIRNMI